MKKAKRKVKPQKKKKVLKPKTRAASARSARSDGTGGNILLLIGTRKGAFIMRGDPSRKKWDLTGPLFLGHIIHHVVLDPRDRRTMVAAARTGHLGPTVFRSRDQGRTWNEARIPPAFPKAPEGEKGQVLDHVFWLTPGHGQEKDVWYAGSSPAGLFRSADAGETWEGVAGFNQNPMYAEWIKVGGGPDGQQMHSILIDPRDPRHMYVGISLGGVFETTDGGANWKPLNQGVAADFLPIPNPEYGHDPHCVRLHPLMPDRLYQQNHCGIYRMDRSEAKWNRIGTNMPKEIGDIGFPMVLHPRDPNTIWVFPMDGTTVWPRTSPDGKPAAYISRDAGQTWKRQEKGLPVANAWLTVKRQAMSADASDPVGLYFGTTSGEVWASVNEGSSWKRLVEHLPHIYSLEVGVSS